MKTADVRASFLKYFERLDHRIVASDSLIPSTDPTLLFTSAGMVQFKPNFQDPSTSPFKRAASCQKCLRTSDIERVGQTLRHLTFFEMLGNFSFGDYFKKDAIAWGWEFLTRTQGLPADRFIVSVHKSDDEAFGLWEKLVPKDRIVRLGDDTNFWTMGPTGPCGPCSEILWDRGPAWSCGKSSCGPDCDCDRYLEVWNLVFTQFDRSADGTLTPLPRKNIDTGMGLERLSLLTQGASSPFGTDVFQALFKALENLSGRQAPAEPTKPVAPAPEGAAFRRIADHSRAVAFMVNDGILPSNEGRGYVLRRLLRQAVRAGKTLGLDEPFLYRLTGEVVGLMQSAYPDVAQRRETIASVVKIEEQKFLETLDKGTRRLEELVQSARVKKWTTLPGAELFQLYDTYGFPFELTQEMAESMGLQVDAEGFQRARQEAVELARQAWKGSGAQDVERYHEWKAKLGVKTVFRGYDTLELQGIIRGLVRRTGSEWQEVSELHTGQEGEAVFAETPFYAEGGGQVGDVGRLESSDGKAEVQDTQSPVEEFTVHRVRVARGTLAVGKTIGLHVDPVKREGTMRHHTATHLLHRALREVLGAHVTQAGSLVAPDRLRFDFNHSAPLTREERQRVEDLVNQKVFGDIPVRACPMTKDRAHQIGAMMLFGEKYSDNVRAVMVSAHDCSRAQEAWSLELCGGTHVHATGQVGLFKIIGQSAVSAGVRRIEAVAGFAALEAIRRMEHELATTAETLRSNPDEVAQRVDKLLAQIRDLQKESEALKSKALRAQFEDVSKSMEDVGGIRLISRRVDNVEDKQLREVADRLRDSNQAGLVVVATVNDGKVSFVVSVQKDVAARGIHAGQLAKELSGLIQGSGGGRPDFAQGGGRAAEALDGALAQVGAMVKRLAVRTPHKNS